MPAGNNYVVPDDVNECYKKYKGNNTAQFQFCENPDNWINSVLAFNVDTGKVGSSPVKDNAIILDMLDVGEAHQFGCFGLLYGLKQRARIHSSSQCHTLVPPLQASKGNWCSHWRTGD